MLSSLSISSIRELNQFLHTLVSLFRKSMYSPLALLAARLQLRRKPLLVSGRLITIFSTYLSMYLVASVDKSSAKITSYSQPLLFSIIDVRQV